MRPPFTVPECNGRAIRILALSLLFCIGYRKAIGRRVKLCGRTGSKRETRVAGGGQTGSGVLEAEPAGSWPSARGRDSESYIELVIFDGHDNRGKRPRDMTRAAAGSCKAPVREGGPAGSEVFGATISAAPERPGGTVLGETKERALLGYFAEVRLRVSPPSFCRFAPKSPLPAAGARGQGMIPSPPKTSHIPRPTTYIRKVSTEVG